MKISMTRILAIGVPLGILCGVIKIYFNIPSETFWRYYCIVAVAAIFLIVLYHYQFGKKLKELSKILLEDKDADQFIEGNKRLLNKTRGKYHRALIHTNLSAGYCDKGDYETAKEVLVRVRQKDLKGINRIIYYISLSYIYFMLKDIEEAFLILRKFGKEFSKLENHKSVGGHVAVLKIFDLIYTDKVEEAQSLLLSAKEKWTDERLEKVWKYLQEITVEKESKN